MDMSRLDLANTPGIYYALAYGLSALLFIYINPKKSPLFRRILLFGFVWAILLLFMTFTYRIHVALFIPCMALNFFLIYLMLRLSCDLEPRTVLYYAVRTFMLGEFAASLEWQLFYYGLTVLGLPLRLSTNLLFLFSSHGCVFLFSFLLERRFRAEQEPLEISRKNLWTVIGIAAVFYALSNLSYFLKNTPFSTQLTWEIFLIRTLTDLGGVAVLFGFHHIQQELSIARKLDSLRRLMKQQYENYRVSEESMELVNRKYHDLKHQLAYLKSEVGEAEKLEVLREMENEIHRYEVETRTGNHVVDTVLMGKRLRAAKERITLTAVVDGAAMSFLSVTEICSLLGNALDNAIEAVERLPEPADRLISLSVYRRNGFLRVLVENRCAGSIRFRNGLPVGTGKSDPMFHGFGVRSMAQLAEKYEGSIQAREEDGWFRLMVLLPLPAPEETTLAEKNKGSTA